MTHCNSPLELNHHIVFYIEQLHHHYKHIFQLFKSISFSEKVQIEGLDFNVINFNETYIALYSPILDILKKQHQMGDPDTYVGFYDKVSLLSEQYNTLYKEKVNHKNHYEDIKTDLKVKVIQLNSLISNNISNSIEWGIDINISSVIINDSIKSVFSIISNIHTPSNQDNHQYLLFIHYSAVHYRHCD